MDAKEIIQSVLDALNISALRLSEEMGVSPSRINDILTGRTAKVMPKTARAIIKAHPGLSYNYLISGDGPMFTDGEHHEPSTPALTPSQVIQTIYHVYHTNGNRLSEVTGIARGTFSCIITGKGNPKKITKLNAQRIKAAYPELRIEWLMTGRGAMTTDGKMPPMLVPVRTKPSADANAEIDSLRNRLDEMEKKYNRKICQILSQLEDEGYSGMAADDIVHHEI